jgi:hypothetical protein
MAVCSQVILLIPPGAERFVTRAGKDHGIRRAHFVGAFDGIDQFFHRLQAKGVHEFGAIDGYPYGIGANDVGDIPILGHFSSSIAQ